MLLQPVDRLLLLLAEEQHLLGWCVCWLLLLLILVGTGPQVVRRECCEGLQKDCRMGACTEEQQTQLLSAASGSVCCP